MKAFENGLQPRVQPRDRAIENSHRIANELGLLAAVLQRQISKVRDGPEMISREVLVEALSSHFNKLIAVSRLHHAISRVADEDDVDLKQVFTDLFQNFQDSGLFADRLHLSLTFPPRFHVTAAQASALTLAFSEIVTNAMKYAHPTGLPVEIAVTGEQTPNGGFTLDISDDGVGFPEGFVETRDSGVGLKLVRSLVDSAGGRLAISSDELGLAFHIELPRLEMQSAA